MFRKKYKIVESIQSIHKQPNQQPNNKNTFDQLTCAMDNTIMKGPNICMTISKKVSSLSVGLWDGCEISIYKICFF